MLECWDKGKECSVTSEKAASEHAKFSMYGRMAVVLIASTCTTLLVAGPGWRSTPWDQSHADGHIHSEICSPVVQSLLCHG